MLPTEALETFDFFSVVSFKNQLCQACQVFDVGFLTGELRNVLFGLILDNTNISML